MDRVLVLLSSKQLRIELDLDKTLHKVSPFSALEVILLEMSHDRFDWECYRVVWL